MKKFILLIVITTVFFSCGKEKEKNSLVETVAISNASTQSKKEPTTNALQQDHDYSKLFIRDGNDCEILSISEIASALALGVDNVKYRDSNMGYCYYNVSLNDGTDTYHIFHPLPYTKQDIAGEIESFREMEKDFGENNQQGYVLLSETGDTYFCIRSSRGELYMYNPNYDGAILIKFGSTIESATSDIPLTDEQKKERLQNAIALANACLKKYKN